MTAVRSDEDILGRLIERSRLLVAISDEIPAETKLQAEPLLRQLGQLLSGPPGSFDVGRIHATHAALCGELEAYADLDALLSAMRHFLPRPA